MNKSFDTWKDESDLDEYKVYSYFKRHPINIVTFISFFSTMIVFVMNTIQYFQRLIYCRKWEIDTTLFKLDNGVNFIYEFAYYFSISAILLIITIKVFLFLQEFFLYRSLLYVYGKKVQFYDGRQKNHLEKIQSLKTEYHKNAMADELLRDAKIKVAEINEDIQQIKSTLYKVRCKLIIGFIVAFFILFFMILSVLAVNEILFGNPSLKMVLYAGIDSAFIYILFCLVLYFDYKKRVDLINCAWTDDVIKEYDEHEKAMFNNLKTIEKKKQNPFRITDGEYKNVLEFLLLSILIVIFSVILLTCISDKNELNITEIEKKEYVVVLNNNNSYVLKPAMINGNQIEVETSFSLVTSDNLKYEKKKFELIRIISEED